MATDLDKRVIDMTASEFADVIAEAFRRAQRDDSEKDHVQEANLKENKRYVYGIAGIAQLFNCSMTTANRIKASGKIDKAISQTGRMIAVDADLALQLMKK